MIRKALLITLLSGVTLIGSAQQKISFFASDSLRVIADLYLRDVNLPFIILLHQADASRGEYIEIAPRLLKLGYNCLAVDLRAGSKINYISNETVLNARKDKLSRSFLGARKDIWGALEFIKKYNDLPVILMGSSYSASLSLIEANDNSTIKAVVALSPGEYFRPDLVVKDHITNINIPVFATATKKEVQYVRAMLADIPGSLLTLYEPVTEEGEHGAKMLWEGTESSDACWLELLLFFKKLR